MKKYVYIRCPVCGKMSMQGNYMGKHSFDIKQQEIGSRGRAKGYIIWRQLHDPEIYRHLLGYLQDRLKEILGDLGVKYKAWDKVAVEPTSIPIVVEEIPIQEIPIDESIPITVIEEKNSKEVTVWPKIS